MNIAILLEYKRPWGIQAHKPLFNSVPIKISFLIFLIHKHVNQCLMILLFYYITYYLPLNIQAK